MNPITAQRNAQAETHRILDHLQSGRFDAAARPIGYRFVACGDSGFLRSRARPLGFLGRLITRIVDAVPSVSAPRWKQDRVR